MEQHVQRNFELTRDEVEGGAIERFLLGIAREAEVRGGISRIQGRIGFFISGYRQDPRELFEIPEVRDYFHRLDGIAPFFLYYIADELQGPLVRLYVKMFLDDGNYFANLNPSESDRRFFDSFLTSRLNAVAKYCMSIGEKEGVEIDPDDVAYHIMRSCGINVSREGVRRLRS